MTGAALIDLDQVSLWYGDVLALDKVSMRLERGGVVALSGPNGCGKSTLLRLVNGLVFPMEGSYRFDGEPVNERSMKDQRFAKHLHQRLGFVFQNPDTQLFCPSVREELSFGLRQMGLSDKEVESRTDEMLELFSLGPLQARAPYHLSGGEKRKVSIACILAMNPDALVLDEPTNGLDEDSQTWLLALMQSLAASGKTIILATHHRDVIQALGARELRIDKNHRLVNDEGASRGGV